MEENNTRTDILVAQLARLKEAMPKGVVKFSFKKANGEIRIAFGTTKSEILEGTFAKKAAVKRLAILNTLHNAIADQGFVLIDSGSPYHNDILESLNIEQTSVTAKEGENTTFPYFDLESQTWKSFRLDALLTVD